MAFPMRSSKAEFPLGQTVTTAEDWQLGTRIAMICGVVDLEITGSTDGGIVEIIDVLHPPTEWRTTMNVF
jgi:hypothetical protein